MFGARRSGWTVAPEGGVVHLRLDRPPSVLECYEIVDRVREAVGDGTVVVLEGRGWSTPRTWKLARLLREVVATVGARVRVESAALRWSVIDGLGATAAPASVRAAGPHGEGPRVEGPRGDVTDPPTARSA